jgi:hypothetical protein
MEVLGLTALACFFGFFAMVGESIFGAPQGWLLGFAPILAVVGSVYFSMWRESKRD